MKPSPKARSITALATWKTEAVRDIVRTYKLAPVFQRTGIGKLGEELFGEEPAAYVHAGDVRHAGALHIDADGHGIYVLHGSLRVDGPFAFYAHDAYTVLVVTGDLEVADLLQGSDSQLIVLGKTTVRGLLYLAPSDAGFAVFRGAVAARERLIVDNGVEGSIGFAKTPSGIERSLDDSGASDRDPDTWSAELAGQRSVDLVAIFRALVAGKPIFAPASKAAKAKAAKGKPAPSKPPTPAQLAKMSLRQLLGVTGFASAQVDGPINPNYLKKGKPGQALESLHLMADVSVEFPELTGLRELKLLGYSTKESLAPIVASLPKLSKLRTLRLVNLPLARCPSEVGTLVELEHLEIRGTHFETLPAELGKLASLRTLELIDNRLTSLPPELAQLTKLEQVVIREPKLAWPRGLERLRKLAGA